ncbi:hypothetical protein M758_10G134000 [Ceratodon purpureus]|uniref:F-box domain-containing protein n=1 Tax=Ceratodon purpureus TaxID=3225 RepID=A0A8T0GLN9_CERPU|nr:hypothetical protein KC19_10G138700 [Ceratodon purpureus]KAG0603960.1 hypothetical protein M758_10G134000 [Ceratodon purpureus]
MGAAASTSEELQVVAMDEGVWQSLPEDLIERVLAWLPIHSLFKMRCVCKQWNSILFSERFVTRYTEVSPQKPWIIMYTAGRTSSAYNSTLKKWHDLVIPAVSPEKCVLAASEGLLCYGNEFFPWPNLFVCNPMTKFWQHLPPMRFIKTIHVVGMVSDRASKSFKILVAGLFFDEAHNGRLATEIFCSTANAWTIGGKPWPIMAAAWKLGAGYAVWSRGLFYCITFSPFGVIAYDLEKNLWDEVHVRMPASIVSPSLVECHGRLLMVGGCEEGTFLGIRIWELERSKMVWVEIERMPRKMRREFVELLRPSRHFFGFGNGNLICLTISESSPAIVFDLDDRSWQWLPGCPRLPDINNWQLRGISFEPRLDSNSHSSWGKDVLSANSLTLEDKPPNLLPHMTVGITTPTEPIDNPAHTISNGQSFQVV